MPGCVAVGGEAAVQGAKGTQKSTPPPPRWRCCCRPHTPLRSPIALLRCCTLPINGTELQALTIPLPRLTAAVPPAAMLKPSQGIISKAVVASGAAALAASLLLSAAPASAEFRLPPIGNDPDRCARGFVGNTVRWCAAVCQ